MADTNARVLLTTYPTGMPQPSDFKLVNEPLPQPKKGEVLVRTIYMSLYPYMRGRMSPNFKSYMAPVELGNPPPATAVGEVIASEDPSLNKGDLVHGMAGWQSHWVAEAKTLRRIQPSQTPLSYELGMLGMPGLTAYVGLLFFGEPKAGETVFVSAATGAVGSVVGQIAKIKGCKVVGIASTEEKCKFAVEELGYDACVNHHKGNLRQVLKEAAPNGIDINFENVGGDIFWDVLALMNLNGRAVICGAIASYNATRQEQGLDRTAELLTSIVVRRLQLKGILVSDHFHRYAEFRKDMAQWMEQGKLKYREDIVQGLDNVVPAFQGLLEGKNFGKLVVQLHPDPARK